MSGYEIDPVIVKAWVTEAKQAVKQFLDECETVEYVADNGTNIMSMAQAYSARLRQRLMSLEKRADALRHKKPS
jgi:hypothetical protein